MKRLAFVAGVPEKIRGWASDQIARRGETDQVAVRIRRLVEYDLMSRHWGQLALLSQRHAMFDLLEFSIRAVTAPSYWHLISKERGSTVTRVTVSIRKAAQKLARLMSDNRELLDYWLTYDIDTATLLRDAALQTREPLVNALYPTEVETFLQTFVPKIEDAGLARYFPDIATVLTTLALRVGQIVDNEETLLRPRGAQARGADRTYTVRVLSQYMQRATSARRNPLIAAVVNVVYDDPDARLDKDQIKDLIGDL